MSSDRQIAANRSNAQRSTGPRTPNGKAKVSVNALTHGLTGRDIVLPNESPDEFDAFRAGLLISLAPQGALEAELANRIIAEAWRLRRVPTFEAALFRRGHQELLVKQAAESVSQYESTKKDRVLAALEEKEVALSDQQAHRDAQQRLEHARAELDDSAFNGAHVLGTSSQPLSNLWRYEAALIRSWLRTMHELERLQARRAGKHVSAPAVMDVNVQFPNDPLPDNGGDCFGREKNGNQQ
jgi:hypothetical protein